MSAELRAIVNAAIDAHPDSSPQEIAIAAAAQVPAKQLRTYLAEALVDTARHLIGNGRRDSLDGSVGESGNSPKLRDRASWWAQMLTERVCVGGVWMTLGDCGYDDLQACIDDREKLISRVSGQIDNFKRLQKLLLDTKAKRVSDVPAQESWAA